MEQEPVAPKALDLLLNEVNNDTINVNNLKALMCRKGIPEEETCVRSVIWKLCLEYLPPQRHLWKTVMQDKSLEYDKFCNELIVDLDKIDAGGVEDGEGEMIMKQVDTDDHPLSTDAGSVWHTYFEDKEMKEQVDRDIERTHPDLNYFSGIYGGDGLSHRSKMSRSLFLFYKLNPGIRYVQGMNELYAVLYYVFGAVEIRSKADEGLLDAVQGDPEVAAFYCFVNLMTEFRDNFCLQLDKSKLGISGMMQEISSGLKAFDNALWNHIECSLQVTPQLYAFRWVTTLLTQEFALPEVILIWDRMLGDSESMKKYLLRFCVSMVLLEREHLLQSDFAGAMKLLQNYPIDDIHILLKNAERLSIYKSIIVLNE